MKKISVTIIFLLCIGQLSGPCLALTVESSQLNPPTRIDSIPFRQLTGTICMALAMYKLDAVDGERKEAIIKEHGRAFLDRDVRFDLEKMDARKKGWTRYYPVFVGAQTFVVRIFLTRELSYQSPATVLYEMSVPDPQVTCQILPSISSIVESQKISPIAISVKSPADSSL